MSKITKEQLINTIRENQKTLLDIDLWRAKISDDVSELMFNLKKNAKITEKGALDVLIEKIERKYVDKLQADTSVQISENSQITDIPKSAPLSGMLDNLEARMMKVERMLDFSICDDITKVIPEPQKERNIVFDYFVSVHGEKYTTRLAPTDFDEVTAICKTGVNTVLFAAKNKPVEYPRIYIGHYE
jgi:hypothetical protein